MARNASARVEPLPSACGSCQRRRVGRTTEAQPRSSAAARSLASVERVAPRRERRETLVFVSLWRQLTLIRIYLASGYFASGMCKLLCGIRFGRFWGKGTTLGMYIFDGMWSVGAVRFEPTCHSLAPSRVATPFTPPSHPRTPLGPSTHPGGHPAGRRLPLASASTMICRSLPLLAVICRYLPLPAVTQRPAGSMIYAIQKFLIVRPRFTSILATGAMLLEIGFVLAPANDYVSLFIGVNGIAFHLGILMLQVRRSGEAAPRGGATRSHCTSGPLSRDPTAPRSHCTAIPLYRDPIVPRPHCTSHPFRASLVGSRFRQLLDALSPRLPGRRAVVGAVDGRPQRSRSRDGLLRAGSHLHRSSGTRGAGGRVGYGWADGLRVGG